MPRAGKYRERVGVLFLSVQRLQQGEVSSDSRRGRGENGRVGVQRELELRILSLLGVKEELRDETTLTFNHPGSATVVCLCVFFFHTHFVAGHLHVEAAQ